MADSTIVDFPRVSLKVRLSYSPGKQAGPHEEGNSGGPDCMSPHDDVDLESVYS